MTWLADLLALDLMARFGPGWIASADPRTLALVGARRARRVGVSGTWISPAGTGGFCEVDAGAAGSPEGVGIIDLRAGAVEGPDLAVLVLRGEDGVVTEGWDELVTGSGAFVSRADDEATGWLRDLAAGLARGEIDPLDRLDAALSAIAGAASLGFPGGGAGELSLDPMPLADGLSKDGRRGAMVAGELSVTAGQPVNIRLPGIAGSGPAVLEFRHRTGRSLRAGVTAGPGAERVGTDGLAEEIRLPAGEPMRQVVVGALDAVLARVRFGLPPLFPEWLPREVDPLDSYLPGGSDW